MAFSSDTKHFNQQTSVIALLLLYKSVYHKNQNAAWQKILIYF